MSRPTSRPSKGKTARKPTPPEKTARAKGSARKTPKAVSKRTPAELDRERLRAALPAPSDRYAELWDRGAAKAHTSRSAQPLRVAVRSVHKKRLAKIEEQTGLDRQTILNKAIATGWEALLMNGTGLDAAAARLRRQQSAAAGTVTLHPTAETLRIFRKAKHRNARAILLQTGLNAWAAA